MASASAAYDEELSSRLLKHQIRLTVGLIKHSLVVNEDDNDSSFHHSNILLSPHFLVCTLSSLLSGTKKDARAQLARTLLCHRIIGKFLRDNVNDFVAAHCDHCKSMMKKNKMSLRVDTYQYWDTNSPRKPHHQKLWKKYHCLAKELPLMHEPKACLDTVTSINQDFLDSDGETTLPMLSASNYDTLVSDSIDTLLVSSVHFKSPWSKEFELQSGEFRKSNGETIQTELLYNKKSFHYYQDRESMSRAIEIKFANHGTVSMVAILPDENISVHHYVKHLLDYHVLKRILKNLTTRFEVQLTLPKFALKAKVNMAKPLQVLRSFVPKNNRDNESIQSIDKKIVLVQRIAIEVDEKGANSKQQQQQLPGLMNKLRSKSNVSRKEAEFKADRPFLFLIVTNGEHRQILFAGLCNDPTQECV